LGADSLQKRSVLGVLLSRIVKVAVMPEPAAQPGGMLSIAIRTTTRCARRTQV
jgi:hypothetical protein